MEEGGGVTDSTNEWCVDTGLLAFPAGLGGESLVGMLKKESGPPAEDRRIWRRMPAVSQLAAIRTPRIQ